jgi:plasmid stabilization system protein ParE
MYRLVYLPSAEQDFLGIVTYISIDLANPKAAEDLIDLYERRKRKMPAGKHGRKP